MKFTVKNKLLNYILSNTNEAVIFAYYLEVDITEVYMCINKPSYRVLNKHRGDQNPSFGLQYYKVKNKIKLWGRDFAVPYYTGDCFHYAGMVLGLNCNNPVDFISICNHIIENVITNGSKHITLPSNKLIKPIKSNSTIEIKPIPRDINKHDIEYWKSYGIKEESIVRERIFCVDKFYINNELDDYTYNPNNPAYAYYLGNNPKPLWEIYRPFENKYKKFRTNNQHDVKELYTIIPNDNLILTKAKKEKALITQLLIELNITNTGVLYTSESNRLKQHTRVLFKENYKNVYVNFDLDIPGIEGMKYFNVNYNYTIFPFTSKIMLESIKNHPKDITDFCKRFGYENTKKLFAYLYEKYIIQS